VTMAGPSVALRIAGGEPGAFVGEASFLEVSLSTAPLLARGN